ncbi:MAG TPA: hypothetical protein VE870_00595, partial [Bacteroidales bacterium]|nr:hypothetical protein [Bacteroidales bacterium]
MAGSNLFMAGTMVLGGCIKHDKQPAKPNILWIIAEDMSPDLLFSTPELFTPDGLKYACRKTAGGFNAEFSILSNFISEKQGRKWEALRMNVIIHDKDGKVQKRYTWRPEWGKEGETVGSGTFIRNKI